jgi:hypothetical protein
VSKKTKAEKHIRRTRKPRPARKHLRKNPAFGSKLPADGTLLGDPIFLHHMAGAILRALTIYGPPPKPGEYKTPKEITPIERPEPIDE